MTERAQSVAIAKACGHKRESKRFKMADGKYVTGYRWTCVHHGGGFHGWGWQQTKENADFDLVCYPRDLNSMHEAEKVLERKHLTVEYGNRIRDFSIAPKTKSRYGLIHATAAERAKAFLETLGRWDDSE